MLGTVPSLYNEERSKWSLRRSLVSGARFAPFVDLLLRLLTGTRTSFPLCSKIIAFGVDLPVVTGGFTRLAGKSHLHAFCAHQH